MSYVSESLDLRKINADIDRMIADYQRLLQFEKDMIDQLEFKVGDRVTLKEDYSGHAQGWSHYKNMLVSGNPATIVNVGWNSWSKCWYAELRFDTQWSESWWTSDKLHVYVQGTKKNSVFSFGLNKLRSLTDNDKAPEHPKAGLMRHPIIPDKFVEVTVHEV